jgi:hypothetical protein
MENKLPERYNLRLNNQNAKKKAINQNTDKICKYFGCCKVLKSFEALASDYCFHHAQVINQKERGKLF